MKNSALIISLLISVACACSCTNLGSKSESSSTSGSSSNPILDPENPKVQAAAAASAEGTKEFAHGEFVMKYPQSWTTVPKQEPVIFNVKTLDGLVNVVVTEEKRPEGATAEQYCEAEIKSLKNDIKSFQLVSHEPFEVKDADARQIVLTQTYDEGTDHALKLEQRQVVVFGPSKTYTVSTACPVELTETFDKPIDDMFSSISINKSGSEQE